MSVADKLERVLTRVEELKHLLATAEGGQFGTLSKELSELEPLAEKVGVLRAAERARDEAEAMLADPEPELRALAEAEYFEQRDLVPVLERELRLMLLPRDAADERSAILEVRPAAGGDEAALFAAELFRAYQRYAEGKRWRFEVLDYDESDLGGVRGAVAEIEGKGVFARLKFESGVHRVQRVPATETQGRIHTSTVTVAVLPQAEEVDVQINEGDLRIDTYRASGAGGQHVNKTDSAVRITHLPTGVVVAMQEEKSQHKNRAKAMKVLRARLFEAERSRAAATRAADRRSQVGTGDRSRAHPHLQLPAGPRDGPPHRPDLAQDRPRDAGRVRRARRRAHRGGAGGQARGGRGGVMAAGAMPRRHRRAAVAGPGRHRGRLAVPRRAASACRCVRGAALGGAAAARPRHGVPHGGLAARPARPRPARRGAPLRRAAAAAAGAGAGGASPGRGGVLVAALRGVARDADPPRRTRKP